jgi:L-ascorbate metabolism protein UlaG (beta-lactamase superfamily)
MRSLNALPIILILLQTFAIAGLDKYPDLLVDDGSKHPENGIRVTYLGTNGYQLEAKGHALLIDPFFSRPGILTVLFNTPVRPVRNTVATMLGKLRSNADAVLVTHAHYDHLLDVPLVMTATGAVLVGSETAVNLARAANAPRRFRAVNPGDRLRIGPWSIRILRAVHDRVLCLTPHTGERHTVPRPPRRTGDWVLGKPLAFVIEAAGQRIYVDSGGRPGNPPPRDVGSVDLAILGTALPDSRKRYAEAVKALHPRYVLPSHQDDFFRPLDRGFTFGLMTDFTYLLKVHRDRNLPGRIVLLDYFKAWTIPSKP